jgi:hypothetical protein
MFFEAVMRLRISRWLGTLPAAPDAGGLAVLA